jgi:hypothetical protein
MEMATEAGEDRELDIGRVIERGFAVIGRHFLPLTALVLALSAAPQAALQYQFQVDVRAGIPVFASPYYWGSMAVSMIMGSLVQATLVRASIRDLRGKDPDFPGSVAEAVMLIPALVGISFLSGLMIGVGMILLIVPGVIAILELIVSVPALVHERLGVVGSMTRSRDLTKGSRWPIFLLVVLGALAFGALSFALSAIGGMIPGAPLWGPAIAEGWPAPSSPFCPHR